MGIGMIFLGYFGISGLGFFGLTFPPTVTYNLKEDFVSLDSWTHIDTAQIVPTEIMRLSYVSGAESSIKYVMTRANLPATFEIRFSLSSNTAMACRVLVLHSDRLCALLISNNAIQVYSSQIGDTKQISKIHVANTFYIYRVTMNDAGQYIVYEGTNELVSGVMYVPSVRPSYMVYVGLSGEANSSFDVDYFYDVQGVQSPVYRVSIDAYCNTEAKAVTAQVQADGTNQKNTPCTYDFAIGTSHQIVVIGSNDIHPFLGWDSQMSHSVILVVSSEGSHVAHYEQSAPTTYTVDVSAFCDSEGSSVSVTVVSEGISKQTPCSFTYNLGTSHTISAASQDGSAHSFLGWDSSTNGNTNLQVSSSGSHVAHYRGTQGGTDYLVLTTFIYNGTGWQTQGNVQANAYKQNGASWDFVKTVTTQADGSTVGVDTSFGVGIYKFEATWNGVTNNTIDEGLLGFPNTDAIGGENWHTSLYLGHGPIPTNPNPPPDIITQIFNAIRGFLGS